MAMDALWIRISTKKISNDLKENTIFPGSAGDFFIHLFILNTFPELLTKSMKVVKII